MAMTGLCILAKEALQQTHDQRTRGLQNTVVVHQCDHACYAGGVGISCVREYCHLALLRDLRKALDNRLGILYEGSA